MSSGADRRPARLAAFLLVPLAFLFPVCKQLSPEERVRQMIPDAVTAARDGDLESLRRVVSKSYRDPLGNGRRELLALVGFQLRQGNSIHLLERTRSVRRTGPARVEAQLLLAAAAVPIDDLRALDRISADLLLIDLVFEEEARGEWRVVEARWQRAGPADLF